MTDWLQIGPMLVNLERVDALKFDQARISGKPGRCHKILFADREFHFDDDSSEGKALREWAEGEGFELAPSLPFISAPIGCVSISPMTCPDAPQRDTQAIREMVRASVDFTPAVSVPCCRTQGEGGVPA